MDSSEFVVSAEALLRVIITLLYLPIVLISYRWLIPRLSPIAKRLASVMLVAQILIIVLALQIQASTTFDHWLWNINREWNIPTTLATTQLAMVVGVAWITAWQARNCSNRHRVYLLGTGFVFFLFLLDEHLTIHEDNTNWLYLYIALGIALTAATLLSAARAALRDRIWHICLLVGLSLSGYGAMIIDKQGIICETLGFLRLNGCLLLVPVEETFEFLGIWLALVAMLGFLSNAIPRPAPRVRLALYSIPAVWLCLIVAYALFPRLELRFLAQPASAEFERGIQLLGTRIETSNVGIRVQLYATAKQPDSIGLGYSIHLVDQDSGKSVASHDKWAGRHHSLWFLGPDYMPIYRQSMEMIYPPQIPVNRAFWLVLTTWRMNRGEFQSQLIINSDLRQLNETQVVVGELVLPAGSAPSSSDPMAIFENGFGLQAADVMDRARPGETLEITFTWRSDVNGREDQVQFLHLGHEESGEWWVYDQQPLGARLPTRLWYSGLADSEVWQVPLPAGLAPGRYHVFTGLYRLSDQERVPATDTEGTPFIDARVPLGSLTIE